MWVLLVLILAGIGLQNQACADREHDHREPECTEPCVGGKCVATDECQCLSGHQFVNGSRTVCEPICSKNCGNNARCSDPETCACNEGYLSFDGRIRASRLPLWCIPNCGKLCLNGLCVAPNECRCLPGYRPSPTEGSSACEPVCRQDCSEHARCIAPDLCLCDKGYVGQGSPESPCVPMCSRYSVSANCGDQNSCGCIQLQPGTDTTRQ